MLFAEIKYGEITEIYLYIYVSDSAFPVLFRAGHM